MLGFGVCSFIFFPQYAYYWKRQQMGAFEKGITDDAEKLKEKGKSRAEIPQSANPANTTYIQKRRLPKNDDSMYQEVI